MLKLYTIITEVAFDYLVKSSLHAWAKELAYQAKEAIKEEYVVKKASLFSSVYVRIINLKVCNNNFRLNNKLKNFLKKAQQCDLWSAMCFL